jgi:two-component system, cell cycle response regulator CpdR
MGGRTNSAPAKLLMPDLVLIVNDEPLTLDLAADLLRELGCEVITSHSADEALRVLDEEPRVTLLLTDVQIPEVNGIELAARARRKRRDLRVVFASGQDCVDGESFVSKPFSREALARVVDC